MESKHDAAERGPVAGHGGASVGGHARSLSCQPGQLRRLTIATLVFVLAVGAIAWLVTVFILRDLSESFITSVITQAKGEAEAVANLAADQGALGEADTLDTVQAKEGAAIDPDALIAPFLPQLFDESGKPLEPGVSVGSPTPPEGGPIRAPSEAHHIVPAQLSRRGQEEQLMVNGQLLARRAFHFIEIRYPGGRSFLNFQNLDVKDYDPAMLDPTKNDINVVRKAYRPSSQRVTIAWDATVSGQLVKLSAGIDSAVLDEGVQELRRRTIPKVLVGGGIFILLLGAAYAYVFRLLRESRRLEAESNQKALLAQVGMLAAGLAHEIRNPLSAVQMNLQLIEEDLSDRARPASAEPVPAGVEDDGCAEHLSLLRSTQREIRRLASLVTDFLTYARPAAPRRQPHSLDSVVRDGVQLFEAAARSAGVRLDIDARAGESPILVDEAMLKQALMNVVVNALEAVPHPGGHVLVSTRRNGSTCEVVVTDDGPGLPPDPESVFAVFHSTKKGGTGLGLAIARALIERQGGSLEARSAMPSPGAVFVIALPAEAA